MFMIWQEPLSTLKGHREAVSGVQWMDFNTLLSSGWDHLLKLWDCELGGIKQEIAGELLKITELSNLDHNNRLNNGPKLNRFLDLICNVTTV